MIMCIGTRTGFGRAAATRFKAVKRGKVAPLRGPVVVVRARLPSGPVGDGIPNARCWAERQTRKVEIRYPGPKSTHFSSGGGATGYRGHPVGTTTPVRVTARLATTISSASRFSSSPLPSSSSPFFFR